jgi:hypothetical protein
MDELIKLVSDKVGLTPDKAKMAVDVVMNHIKGKAPALSGQLDGLMKGGAGGLGSAASGLADAAGGLGGMLGKK